ncbi:MAG: GatB/YqeY domain-containing protein [Desulfobacterales bacterium]|nr:GatB/YqeY domain-containing protein [Desulfobacterales bacterium]
MGLKETIKQDLAAAMKAKNDFKKDTLRVILGELSRLDKKELSDDEVVKVLNKMIKSEQETLQALGKTGDSEYIKIIESYLPQQATPEEIKVWIQANIDFSSFKDKIQAMKPIMKHFGSRVKGDMVKTILQGL